MARLLASEGHEVYGFSRGHAGDAAAKDGLNQISGDVLKPSDIAAAYKAADPHWVIFAAGEKYPAGRSSRSWLELMEKTRVEGVKNVVNALDSAAGVKFITVSGALAYKRPRLYKGEGDELLSKEEDPIDESTWFGRTLSKWEKEVMAKVQSDGLNAVIARMGAVYGWGGQWRQLFFEPMLRHRRVFVPGNGRAQLSYIHVTDAARALIHLLRKGTPGEVYNIVDDEPVSIGLFLNSAASFFKAPHPLYVPLWLTRLALGSSTFSLVKPAFSVSQLVSNAKLKKYEFTFEYPSYESGLKRVRDDALAVREASK